MDVVILHIFIFRFRESVLKIKKTLKQKMNQGLKIKWEI